MNALSDCLAFHFSSSSTLLDRCFSSSHYSLALLLVFLLIVSNVFSMQKFIIVLMYSPSRNKNTQPGSSIWLSVPLPLSQFYFYSSSSSLLSSVIALVLTIVVHHRILHIRHLIRCSISTHWKTFFVRFHRLPHVLHNRTHIQTFHRLSSPMILHLVFLLLWLLRC